MASLLIVLFALAAYGYLRFKIRHLPKEQQQALGKKWLIGGGLILIAILAITKGNVILGLIAGAIPVLMRLLGFLRYLPLIKKILGQSETTESAENAQPLASQGMSKAQAAQILGVSENATKEEIVAAHKRLMQRVHPDRGGSDALAAQINEARKTLLS